jgi:fermentation-respiration switch protein FrsA (DUF1100 family)
MQRSIKIALKVGAIYAAVSIVVAIVMAELTLHPMRLPLPDKTRIAALYAPYGADLRPVAITTADGVELKAWYVLPEHKNDRAVILLHGIGDNRGGVAGYGAGFLAAGYSILMPDSRAHGESGGNVATYGLLESDDIHRWVSWLYDQGATCVDGFGESMGAALVLESLRAEPRFCAVVADSGFSTFRSVAYDREGYFVGAGRLGLEQVVGRTIGLLPAEIALFYARRRYGIDLQKASPLDAVKNSAVPILLIHGDRDINILPRHSRLLAAADPGHTQLWLVPGATHCGAVSVSPREFWLRVLSFFSQYNRDNPRRLG